MKCVVCTRSGKTVKLVTLFKNKCCGSCKTAYYRGLTRLHGYVDRKTKTREDVLGITTDQAQMV